MDTARGDAEILLEEVTGLTRGALRLDPARRVPADLAARFDDLVARRAAREPLQHVVGHWPFLELDLLCDRRALVPRPETEDLALLARAAIAASEFPRAVDVGTGTGCLALALAAAHTGVRIAAVDLSADALALAAENRARVPGGSRVALVRASLLDACSAGAGLDLVVANLPYVAPAEIDGLEPEVRDHEPRLALVAADGGCALLEALVDRAPRVLRTGGALLMEMDPRQVPRLAARARRSGSWQDVSARDDRYGRARFLALRRM